jgi:hemerythrin-like domain-containing protein
MKKLLGAAIKDVISENPEVGKLLESYDIACVPCQVGTCVTKDVFEIHNLDPEKEKSLLEGIANLVYPGQEVEIPTLTKKTSADDGAVRYSPPLQLLVDEHVVIKRLLSLIPTVIDSLDLNEASCRSEILAIADFITNYADKFHHAKEEDILFKYFEEGIEIVQVMCADHVASRNFRKGMTDGVEFKNKDEVESSLIGYQQLMVDHIYREDNILYPWMDRIINTSQVGEMYGKFQDADRLFEDQPERLIEIVETLEEKYKK